jgi:hypothetical protein
MLVVGRAQRKMIICSGDKEKVDIHAIFIVSIVYYCLLDAALSPREKGGFVLYVNRPVEARCAQGITLGQGPIQRVSGDVLKVCVALRHWPDSLRTFCTFPISAVSSEQNVAMKKKAEESGCHPSAAIEFVPRSIMAPTRENSACYALTHQSLFARTDKGQRGDKSASFPGRQDASVKKAPKT